MGPINLSVSPVCMTSKVLSILIVGGENSAEVYSNHSSGSGSRGYVPQLVRQLGRVGWQVQVECHAPIDVHNALPLLQQLNLNRFDLILLELGHTRLQKPAVFSDLFRVSAYDSFAPNGTPRPDRCTRGCGACPEWSCRPIRPTWCPSEARCRRDPGWRPWPAPATPTTCSWWRTLH